MNKNDVDLDSGPPKHADASGQDSDQPNSARVRDFEPQLRYVGLIIDRLSFRVGGEPVSAPRQTRKDAFLPSPHVQRYHTWKDLVRLAARRESKRAPWNGPLGLSAQFWMPIPCSWPKWKHQLALRGELVHASTPDLDNLIKAVKDALNGTLWVDDAQVCRYFEPLFKGFATTPYAQVTVWYLRGHPSTVKRKWW